MRMAITAGLIGLFVSAAVVAGPQNPERGPDGPDLLPPGVAPAVTMSPERTGPPLSDREAARAAFEHLLNQLEAVRLDLSLADADEISAARAALKSALQKFHDEMADDWFTARGVPLVDRDYVSFRNACSPRLDGTVVKIGPGQEFADIATALPNIKPGTLVWLGRGEFNLAEFGRQFNFADLAIVGQGPEFTTLVNDRNSTIVTAARLLIDGLRVDCRDDTLTDLRKNDRLFLRDCLFENYNSGGGGSNALDLSNGVLLLEGCAFDGSKGRSAGRGSGGNALDLRGVWNLFARQCQFIENQEIVRADGGAVFDRCVSVNLQVSGYGVSSRTGGFVLHRESGAIISTQVVNDGPIDTFAVATDDRRLVEHAAGVRREADGELEALVTGLALHRRLPYWIGLLRHDDTIIRGIAAKRLGELIDEPVNLPAEVAAEGETLADLGVLFKCEVECARLLAWLDKHRDQLTWDEATGRYRLQEK